MDRSILASNGCSDELCPLALASVYFRPVHTTVLNGLREAVGGLSLSLSFCRFPSPLSENATLRNIFFLSGVFEPNQSWTNRSRSSGNSTSKKRSGDVSELLGKRVPNLERSIEFSNENFSFFFFFGGTRNRKKTFDIFFFSFFF